MVSASVVSPGVRPWALVLGQPEGSTHPQISLGPENGICVASERLSQQVHLPAAFSQVLLAYVTPAGPALGCRPILFMAPEVAVTPLRTVGLWMMVRTWAWVDLGRGRVAGGGPVPCAPCSRHRLRVYFNRCLTFPVLFERFLSG